MVKHTQTIRREKLTNCLSVCDHFVELALKELKLFATSFALQTLFGVLLIKYVHKKTVVQPYSSTLCHKSLILQEH